MKRLNEYCSCAAEAKEFVGVRYENGKFEIHFPSGYFSAEELSQIPEDDLRTEILSLLDILGDKSLNGFQESQLSPNEVSPPQTDLPMAAYLEVLRDFAAFGYYREQEFSWQKNAPGKIHWKKTLQQIQPVVSSSPCKNIVFLETIGQKRLYDESRLVTQIHRYCVREAVQKIGFLFGMERGENPAVEFDVELFTAALQRKMEQTFGERLLRLFKNMLEIIRHKSRATHGEESSENFSFGVNDFSLVWENLLDRIFGNLKPNEQKENFFPRGYWVLDDPRGKSSLQPLRPDTVMRQSGENETPEIFILDAKFYAGENLPASESITKQIVYGEYVEQNDFGVDGQHIFNAFLLPGKAHVSSKTPFSMQPIGYASGDWKASPDKPYHKIIGIRLNIREVIHSPFQNKTAQKELSKIVHKRIQNG